MSINRNIGLLFLTIVLFLPYQVHGLSPAPQTIVLIIGMSVSAVYFLQQQRWRKSHIDWPLLILIVTLSITIIYHQSFNIHARAYLLSIATYIWLRHTLQANDLPLLARAAIIFLILNTFLMVAQLWFGEEWYVARYFTEMSSFRWPTGFFNIPTTAALFPAVIVLFLMMLEIRRLIEPSKLLNLCYFIVPFSILAPISRTSIISFFGTLFVVILLYFRDWRRVIMPATLLIAGFIFFSLVIFKSQGQLDMGNVFEYKIGRPIKVIYSKSIELFSPSESSEIHQSNAKDMVSEKTEEITKTEVSSKPEIDNSAMSRLYMWKAILERLIRNPSLAIQGIGIGNSETSFKELLERGEFDRKVFGNGIVTPHNSYIEIFYEGGLFVGISLLVFLAYRLLNVNNWNSPWFAAFLFLTMYMLFYDLLRMRYIWIVLALVEVYRSDRIKPFKIAFRVSPTSSHPTRKIK